MGGLGDVAYDALPSDLKSRIDNAFNSVAQRNANDEASGSGASTSRPASPPALAGGGFIVEDASASDERVDEKANKTHISFSLIPEALELLDLPSDDQQILSVFRNAIEDEDDPMDGQDGMKISRQHWRAVCAILLEGSNDAEMEDPSDNEPAPSAPLPAPKQTPAARPRRSKAAYKAPIREEESDDGRDNYEDSGDSDDVFEADEPDSGEEFVVGVAKGKGKAPVKDKAPTRTPARASTSKRASGATTRKSKASDSSNELSPAQLQVCTDAFALFFPSDSGELVQKRIMIKDLQQAAKTVGEKIKADEFMEMLEMFSTAPDKSINLVDFQKIMVSTKLI